MIRTILFFLVLITISASASAQFTGPVAERVELSVEEAREARVGTYATVTGNIINQWREDDYTFRDESGEIRVEIAPGLWSNRRVSPETNVRLFVEVDSNRLGKRYLWLESLQIVAEPES